MYTHFFFKLFLEELKNFFSKKCNINIQEYGSDSILANNNRMKSLWYLQTMFNNVGI